MRLSRKVLLSLAASGALLTLPVSRMGVRAENAPEVGPPAPAPAAPAPAAPAPSPTTPAQPVPTTPAQPEVTDRAQPLPVPTPVEPAPSQDPGPKSLPQTPAAQQPRDKSQLPGEVAPVSETPEENRFVDLVNEERTKRGLSQLRIDPLLIGVARLHSAEMRDKAYFNHESPTAAIKTPLDRYMRAVSHQPTYACVGENLFWATIADVKRGHAAFMNSPTHRENILFPRFEKIGVGIVRDAKGEFWVTQMFLTNTDPVSVAKNKLR